MARQRMIHPELWGSSSVGRLSVHARLLWIGIFSNADDDGRMQAEPGYLRSLVFPFDRVSEKKVADCLEEIEAEEMIRRYAVGRSHYLVVTKFRHWQKPKYPTVSKLPTPPETDHSGQPSPGLGQASVLLTLQEGRGGEETKRGGDKEGRRVMPPPSGASSEPHLRRFLSAEKTNDRVAALIDAGAALGIKLKGGRVAAIVRKYGHGQDVINALTSAVGHRAAEPHDYIEGVLRNAEARQRTVGARAGPPAADHRPSDGWADERV